MSVLPSVCSPAWKNSVPAEGFWWNLIFKFFKSVEKIQVLLKSYKNNGYFTRRRFTFMVIPRWILLRMRNVLGKFWNKIKTHFKFNNFFSENRSIYEIVSKNMVESWRLHDGLIQHMLVAQRVRPHARMNSHTPAHPHKRASTHERAHAHINM